MARRKRCGGFWCAFGAVVLYLAFAASAVGYVYSFFLIEQRTWRRDLTQWFAIAMALCLVGCGAAAIVVTMGACNECQRERDKHEHCEMSA